MQKRVLIAGLTNNPGGMESVVMNYFRNMDTKQVVFDFIYVTDNLAYQDEIDQLGGRTFHITSKAQDYIKNRQELKSFFEQYAAEYTAIWYNACSLANIDYLIMAEKYHIPKRIIHCHNAANGQGFVKGIFHKLNQSRIMKFASDFWTCSHEADAWFYGSKLSAEKIMLINNAIDLRKYAPNKTIRFTYRKKLKVDGKIVLGHVGRFENQKNQEFFIPILQKLDPKYVLVLIGEGTEREAFAKRVHEAHLEDRVIFCGSVGNVQDYLQAIDIFLFPSRYEGLSVSLLEAQANGLPCVISNHISKASIINEHVEMLPIDTQGVDKWVRTIDHCSHFSKIVNTQGFEDRGLDIRNEAKKMEEFFCNGKGLL